MIGRCDSLVRPLCTVWLSSLTHCAPVKTSLSSVVKKFLAPRATFLHIVVKQSHTHHALRTNRRVAVVK